jgi:diguanylate cyclase (GGDEF)-like protein/PAS domain S-box-containing protein
MIAVIDQILPTAFTLAAILYVWLGTRVVRGTEPSRSRAISYFLFLIAAMIGGSAFSYGTVDPQMYAIGRVLSFFSGGFLPVVMYLIYREYTARSATRLQLGLLCIIPAATTVLAATNPLHGMLWDTIVTPDGVRFSDVVDHHWFNRVHAPFAYGLFAGSILALVARLPDIARAHRGQVVLFLVSAGLPFAVSVGNTLLRIGPIDFPFTSTTLVLFLPLYWWAAVSLRVHEFSPLAYQRLFDRMRDPIIVLDGGGCIVSANRAARRLLRKREPELIGRLLADELPETRSVLDDADALGKTQIMQMMSDRHYELSSTRLTGPAGQFQGTVVVFRDVTERYEALRALADSEHLIRSLIENSSNGILRFAHDTNDAERRFRCVFANRAAERFLGNAQGALVGMPLSKIELLEPGRLQDAFAGDGKRESVSYEMSVESPGSPEGECWLRVIGEPVGSDFSVTLIDITQRKRTENKMLADALRDPLTGVLNRRGFEKEATACLADCGVAAVLYLDLNHFKSINDRFGHQAGDALLKAFGHRLGFCLRPEDILGRMGGDEFAVVLPGVSVEEARHIAERLVETASEGYIIQGQEIICSASVGIALMPAHGRQLRSLIGAADQAMYRAKASQAEVGDEASARAAIAS